MEQWKEFFFVLFFLNDHEMTFASEIKREKKHMDLLN